MKAEDVIGWTIVSYLLALVVGVAGWVTNAIWTFQQTELGNILLGVLGALVFPIGAVHGIYRWFA